MTYKEQTVSFNGIPRPNRKWFLITLVISALLHLFSYVNVSNFAGSVKGKRLAQQPKQDSKVKIRVVPKPAPDSTLPKKKIIETKQAETAKPKDAKYLSNQDHIAKKETKTSRPSSINDQEVGQGGSAKKATSASKQQPADKVVGKKEMAPRYGVGAGLPKPNGKDSRYQSLLPKAQDLVAAREAGYQDYIDEELDIGDRIDLTTSKYRFIGYFTGLRKGFSQTWVYPSEAVRRGLQGEVKVEFTIAKDGQLERVKVLETSGHDILDDAVLDAVKLSSPYAPLPDGFGKEKLTIVYSFFYRLRGFGAF
ncbi:energy transducer TonB [Pseudobacteriovorax antillogorgiicola]|uniref:TonB family C-terminal domain-containing protein n=1 Tax=Pseudobacteriovorax antillogorgiicola TaxID=1513793 RepID=A0A1Y6B9A6_9BACT|nr:energy transducer TonB [Pseudobacteriovorax antillogorgiicola]TCS59421.1 TonB family protein [Pseudobacteriovorax antillogorgiicola]SME88428.1 TonB family C-terminal domain-containing protein [Pseudobacteriovorax antillogorgiicola]